MEKSENCMIHENDKIIISLRITENHRLYGYMSGRVLIFYGMMMTMVIIITAYVDLILNTLD